MKVEMEITFDRKELEAMCLQRCQSIDTAVPGHFEANANYSYGHPQVTVKFIPDDTEAAAPVTAKRSMRVPAEPVPLPPANTEEVAGASADPTATLAQNQSAVDEEPF